MHLLCFLLTVCYISCACSQAVTVLTSSSIAISTAVSLISTAISTITTSTCSTTTGTDSQATVLCTNSIGQTNVPIYSTLLVTQTNQILSTITISTSQVSKIAWVNRTSLIFRIRHHRHQQQYKARQLPVRRQQLPRPPYLVLSHLPASRQAIRQPRLRYLQVLHQQHPHRLRQAAPASLPPVQLRPKIQRTPQAPPAYRLGSR